MTEFAIEGVRGNYYCVEDTVVHREWDRKKPKETWIRKYGPWKRIRDAEYSKQYHERWLQKLKN